MACLDVFRNFISPCGQRWQYPQSSPRAQPPCRQKLAHGQQFPLRCSVLPWLGVPGGARRPGGRLTKEPTLVLARGPLVPPVLTEASAEPKVSSSSSEFEAVVDSCSEARRSSRCARFARPRLAAAELKAWARMCCSVVGAGFAGFGVARPKRSIACLFFFRALSSPSPHMWQWQQSSPFWQLPGRQYHAHGLHSPLPCRAAPRDSDGPAGSPVDSAAVALPDACLLRSSVHAACKTAGFSAASSLPCSSSSRPSRKAESRARRDMRAPELLRSAPSERVCVTASGENTTFLGSWRSLGSLSPGGASPMVKETRRGSPSSVGPGFGVAPARPRRNIAFFRRLRALISPSGQRWQ
mmetsp:Transcript_16826/g.48936  ORF Transcript_16826/g.48936 Transcript_16826/m.48936 type:complete len:354 (-) Transcript_16826:460-1521(-)